MPTIRSARHPVFAIVLALMATTPPAHARTVAGLECPDLADGQAAAMLSPVESEILQNDDRGQLAPAINDIVSRLQLEQPKLSYAEMVNALIAGYCPIVAAQPDLSGEQKSERLLRFASLAQQQVTANSVPDGSLIIATVPLPPDVYRKLSAQAAVHGESTAKFLAKMLTHAAGQ